MGGMEIEEVAREKSKLLLDYIEQFMSYEGVFGEIRIDSDINQVTNELMCYIGIMLDNGTVLHIPTGITAQQSDVLSEQILIDLVERYGKDENIDITRFFRVSNSMRGINIMNQKGSIITLNFVCRGPEFDNKVVRSYSTKYNDELYKIQIGRYHI